MDRRGFLKSVLRVGAAAITSSVLKACAPLTGVDFEPTAGESGSTIPPLPTETISEALPIATITPLPPQEDQVTQVAFIKTDDRSRGVQMAMDLLDFNTQNGKSVFLKPNFNSADDAPGSTHNDTLTTMIRSLKDRGADRITIGDRSGMGDTRQVMARKEIFRMADELGCDTVVFDELDADGWMKMQVDGGHWRNGFAVARPVLEADGVIQTCCLKTHRYGGHFTLSLKNSVGLVAKTVPGEGHDYMRELHGSAHQRAMIAEINTAYQPDFVLMDGMEAFVKGGPARGTLVQPQLILASTDRVALDAVGVAILRAYGTTNEVSRGLIFEQEQIARAMALGLGATGPDQIELITPDEESEQAAIPIRELLLQG
jgi:uncharacterized protein (DUF362 family)